MRAQPLLLIIFIFSALLGMSAANALGMEAVDRIASRDKPKKYICCQEKSSSSCYQNPTCFGKDTQVDDCCCQYKKCDNAACCCLYKEGCANEQMLLLPDDALVTRFGVTKKASEL
ncbi:hypothetical protein BDZ90DRAFT_262986 [Jaminaea rosea]|uniref:SMB domain-containing protein n=1 Tax=Jaminaea rosea TaxID=1569628 RepID=A0A316UHS4_9BASI|nr:hypothetical protein BDZ90DRAFT_262986 [Jaminaea rosea]PWN24770.1 hypothetical protein BDZ90DRAFT_262986 [Jaminaea rosea]